MSLAGSGDPCESRWRNLPCNLTFLPLPIGFFAYYLSINALAFDRLADVLSVAKDGALGGSDTRASRLFLRTFAGPLIMRFGRKQRHQGGILKQ